MGYLTAATVSFGLTLILIKVASLKASPILSNLVFTGVAAIVQLGVFFYYKAKEAAIYATPGGLGLSAIGGLLLGIYTVTLFISFSQVPISKASPIVYAGGILIASCVGMLWLNETVNWQKLVGVALLMFGLFFVFTR